MQDIVITGAARTPIGAFMGALSSVPADQLGTTAIVEALSRCKHRPPPTSPRSSSARY